MQTFLASAALSTEISTRAVGQLGDTGLLALFGAVVDVVGVNRVVHFLDALFLGQVDEVAAVDDAGAPVCAAPLQELDAVAVPDQLAAVGGRQAALAGAQQHRLELGRAFQGEVLGALDVGGKGERALDDHALGQGDQGGRRAGGHKGPHRHAQRVVADVPGVEGDLAVQRLALGVDAEGLHPRGVAVGPRRDDLARADQLEVLAVDGVGQFQLVLAVQLLGHGATGGVRQHAQAQCVGKGVHIGHRAVKQSRITHTVHHLGVISTAVTPPVQLTAVSPAGSAGKAAPSLTNTSFLFSPSVR